VWRAITALTVAATLTLTISADQGSRTAPAFDVVSIRESDLERDVTSIIQPGSPTPGGWSARNATLRMILERAFPNFSAPGMIVGAPRWADERHFDIEARVDHQPAPSDYPAMLQRILADRFALKTHIEKRTVDVYRLVTIRGAGRLGPRLRPASAQCLSELEAAQRVPRAETGPIAFSSDEVGPCGRRMTVSETVRVIDATPLATLATTLQFYTRQPVVNRTGLNGIYQYDVEWDASSSRNVDVRVDASEGPTIYSALQEQLGLKLERHRDRIDVLFVDAARLPTAN
jgi:uncharacterized protein (TIGR03435 family)